MTAVVEHPYDPIPLSTWYSEYRPAEGWIELAEAKTHPLNNVWTIVEADGVLVAMAGFQVVNRIGEYVVTEKPWVTGGEEVVLECGCAREFGGCDACAPVSP